MNTIRMAPQPGPQTEFLSSDADIRIIGGAAGGGKSWALRYDLYRGMEDPHFTGIVFRRTMPGLMQARGMWPMAEKEARVLGATPFKGSPKRLDFPSGAQIQFTHLQNMERLERNHMGGEYTAIALDELLEFEEDQFWTIVGRARNPRSAFDPWVVASTNPRYGSWVHKLIEWWLDDEGFPDPEKAGVKRYFIRENDVTVWVDEDYRDEDGDPPKSLAFFPAKLEDNRFFGEDYRMQLKILSHVDRMRLLKGSWHARVIEGIFENHQIDPDGVFRGMVPWDECIGPVRFWDLADTEKTAQNPEPDETASAKGMLHVDEKGRETLYVLDSTAVMKEGDDKREYMRRVADEDGPGECEQGIEQEGGATGKEAARDYRHTHLAGHNVVTTVPRGDKVARALRWRPLADTGRVLLVRNPDGSKPIWFDQWLAQVETFDGTKRKRSDGTRRKRDRVDATSGMYARLKQLALQGGWWSTF